MGDLVLRALPDLSLTSDPSWDRLNSKLGRKGPRLTPSLTCRLRWDLLDLGALQVNYRNISHQVVDYYKIVCLQVSEDPPDLKGSWDLRETPETPGLPDLLDYKGSPDCPA